jgi:hypothetical protein
MEEMESREEERTGSIRHIVLMWILSVSFIVHLFIIRFVIKEKI